MFRKKEILKVVLSLIVTLGIGIMSVNAEDELNHGLPETITGMDEFGNVYDVDSSSGYVNTSRIQMYAEEVQVVNFNTKGAVITEYKEAGTGESGYVCGAYGADAAYLGMSGTKVKFMLSGIIGEVEASEVEVVNYSAAKVLSHYVVSNGRLLHKIATNLTSNYYGSTLNQGVAPSYLSTDVQYYSYDGHYFYTDYYVMSEDYNNNTREHSVNPSSPYFNYFQFLPFRSQTNYTDSQLNTILNNRADSSSKMRDLGKTFIDNQNLYGINALLSVGVAANESNWGMSNIAQNKNNLFGLNAVDSAPNQSANYYADVKVCVKDFMETYMSKQYANPNNWKYYGGFLGNKASGANVKYASDPYWGEKAANIAWILDYENGNQDADTYTIGIKDVQNYEHTMLNVRRDASASSTKLYTTGKQSAQAFAIIGEENGFYKIQCDGVLNEGRTEIVSTSGIYSFSDMYAFVSKDYITKVNCGRNIGNNGVWNALTIKTDLEAPQLLQTEINFIAQVEQKNADLQYKFVWEKDNWKSWGVIQDFSSDDTATWIPEEGGEYSIYMDVRDSSGKKQTVIIDYEIKNWGFTTIMTNKSSPQKVNTVIKITPQIIGYQSGLQYKFVWKKGSWENWDIIAEMSTKNTATWVPKETGTYTLYVDVEDQDGYKVTRTIEYEVVEKTWSLKGILFDREKGESGSAITISADVDNANANLEYKFVWEKDNWKSWNVIQDFSSKKTAQWIPEEAGVYHIYVDVQDESGEKYTVFMQYVVEKRNILFDNVVLNQNSPQEVGIGVTITPVLEGNTENLEYKYVWEKDNWESWGVIQNFSEATNCVWTPDEAGEYQIYVDVRAKNTTETVTRHVDFQVNWGTWNIAGMNFDLESPQIPFAQIEIAARIVGNKSGLEYKFVWEKDNWKSWGVVQAFSERQMATWTPTEPGKYRLYVDIKNNKTNQIESKWIYYEVK